MNLRIAQDRGRPRTAGADAPYFIQERDGDWYWRETLRPLYSPSAPVNVLLALFPLRSTLTVLDRLGDFAFRISRREYCQEQERDRSRTNADADGSLSSFLSQSVGSSNGLAIKGESLNSAFVEDESNSRPYDLERTAIAVQPSLIRRWLSKATLPGRHIKIGKHPNRTEDVHHYAPRESARPILAYHRGCQGAVRQHHYSFHRA